MKENKKYDSNWDRSYSDSRVLNGKFTVFAFIFIGLVAFGKFILSEYSFYDAPNTFEFHSKMEFDSVFVKVCGLQTKLFNHEELDLFHSAYVHSGNVVTPASGFPCKTEFTLFKDGAISTYLAPDFDCNHCDVSSHNYQYKNGKITYDTSHQVHYIKKPPFRVAFKYISL